MSEFWKIILIILLSSVKFVAGPPFAFYDRKYDFSFFETVSYCFIGGMLGVIVFSYFSKPIFRGWHWLVATIKKPFERKKMFSEPIADIDGAIEIKYEYVKKDQPKKLFTKGNRRIVRIWQKYGLIGIAFITPVILSIPIGTVIASSLVQDRKKVIIYMFFSVLFWSIFMTSMFEFFHAESLNDLQNHIQNTQ